MVIGELGIIEDTTVDKGEKLARAKQLKRVSKYVWRTYDWDSVKDYHGAFLSAVERAGQWVVNPTELASQFLFVGQKAQSNRPANSQVVYVQQQQPAQRAAYVKKQGERRCAGRHFCGRFQTRTCEHAAVIE